MQMVRDNRIKDCSKGEFRPYLTVEAVHIGAQDKFVQVVDPYGNAETVIVATERPFRVPLLNYMFYVKIANVKDKYLEQAIADLKYLNPGLGRLGIKKLTEYLVNKISGTSLDGTPLVGYDAMHSAIAKLWFSSTLEPDVSGDKVLLFQNKSLIPVQEKRKMTMETRQLRSKYLHGEIIHNAALVLVEVQQELAVKKSQVHGQVQNEKGLKSYRSFNKYLEPKTVKVLEEVAKYRKFYTYGEIEQFEDYMKLKTTGASTAMMVRELGVSYTTLSRYSSIYKDLKIRNMI